MDERRINLEERKKFDDTIEDLKDILSCYDIKYHYEVINNYLKVNKLFLNQETIRGKIFWKLLVWAFSTNGRYGSTTSDSIRKGLIY